MDSTTSEQEAMYRDSDPHEGRGAVVFMVLAWIVVTIAIIVIIAESGRPATLP